MIRVEIPGCEAAVIENVVLDFNGTLACDGVLIEGVRERLVALAADGVQLRLITSDTNGTAASACTDLPLVVDVCVGAGAGEHKRDLVRRLGARQTACIGNGRNDMLMFQESGLAIAVIGTEGCFTKTLSAADIVVINILDALDLLLRENRLRATLRT